ncbi:MAG: 4-hydroxy-tetrahydrodipicolinate synthase [Bacteroidetes bacterium]|nr:4-hydroxy-tetrahydrodipicolinate synthase [Bacteroidota bacterium]MCL1968616.1 4-hydroxy-tetrahydrodipicolinate synthase [Bacteroidota bacterium]
MQQFKGLGVAMVTPFLQNGEVDFANLEQLVNHLINSGVDYLVAMGTTSESPTLTDEEKQKIVSAIVQTNRNRVPVIVGMGGYDTRHIVKQFKTFDFSGVSAILSVTPYYSKPTQTGLIEHYQELAYHAPLPIILYNVGSRTGCNLEPETTLKLAENKNIIGIKEASGVMNQIMYLIKHKPENFLVISGDDAITLPLMAVGADGLISVAGNAFPSQIAQMVHLAQEKLFAEAAAIHYQLLDIIQACFKEGSPAGVKAFLAMQNRLEYYLRLPLVRVSAEHQKYIKELLLIIQRNE